MLPPSGLPYGQVCVNKSLYTEASRLQFFVLKSCLTRPHHRPLCRPPLCLRTPLPVDPLTTLNIFASLVRLNILTRLARLIVARVRLPVTAPFRVRTFRNGCARDSNITRPDQHPPHGHGNLTSNGEIFVISEHASYGFATLGQLYCPVLPETAGLNPP